MPLGLHIYHKGIWNAIFSKNTEINDYSNLICLAEFVSLLAGLGSLWVLYICLWQWFWFLLHTMLVVWLWRHPWTLSTQSQVCKAWSYSMIFVLLSRLTKVCFLLQMNMQDLTQLWNIQMLAPVQYPHSMILISEQSTKYYTKRTPRTWAQDAELCIMIPTSYPGSWCAPLCGLWATFLPEIAGSLGTRLYHNGLFKTLCWVLLSFHW